MKNFILLIAILFNGMACAMQKDIYTYQKFDGGNIPLNLNQYDKNILGERISIVEDENSRMVIEFDNLSLSYKQESNAYKYFPAPLHFALPIKGVEENGIWQFEDAEYRVIGSGALEILGNKYSVKVIRQSSLSCDSGCDVRIFYFSNKDGLIAFNITNTKSKMKELWVSEKNIGAK